MTQHLLEWLHLIIRWLHLTTGIAWIGASFYFNFLENNLNRLLNLREELAGNLWAVHGGGFYYLEKYKVAPSKIPENLHWFKYEAYFTWLSGFLLLCVVYYANPELYLIDPTVMNLSSTVAIVISIFSLLFSWFFYDQLCKTKFIENQKIIFLLIFSFLVFSAYCLSQIFNPRAAYVHVGAMIGTMMVANVFFVIIPSQKELVAAAKEKRLLNAQLGKNALMRSRHNNYFTLPVLFIMMSSHFPFTYGNPYGWLILSGTSLLGVGIRHYFNVRKEKKLSNLYWLFFLVLLFLIIYATAPEQKKQDGPRREISFSEVKMIIEKRCHSCHAEKPTDDVFIAPPLGIIFETEAHIHQFAPRIYERASVLKNMPFANKTNMTDEERNVIADWYQSKVK